LIASYYYDPFGRRLWKEVGGVRTYFHYADEGLIGEYDSTGNEIQTYGYKPGSTWATDPLFMKEGSSYYFYQNDHLGTPQKMTAVNGAVVWSAKYSSFGEATIDAASTVTNPLRFPGQYYDNESGLNYNYHRYYDPSVGRYMRADPIRLEGGINFFLYAENNPVNYADPLGLESILPDSGFPDHNPPNVWEKIIDAYDYAHKTRRWGHDNFGHDSPMRHCVVSCMVASKYGVGIARTGGIVNEIQGLVRWDLPNLLDRIRGRSQWAFQWQDFRDNERGLNCSEKNKCSDNENDRQANCIECCANK